VDDANMRKGGDGEEETGGGREQREGKEEEGEGTSKSRRQPETEVVLIGVNLQKEEVERILNKALMQDGEKDPEDNPFSYLMQDEEGGRREEGRAGREEEVGR